MPSRFDVDYKNSEVAWEPLVDEVFGELTSSFLEMPKGDGFVDYPTFEKGYQTLKKSTNAFAALTEETVLTAVRQAPISFIVFRCILGFSPPEWAYMTTEITGVEVDQGAARSIDRKFRLNPLAPVQEGDGVTGKRIRAMIWAGVHLINEGSGSVGAGLLHRLDKSDTFEGRKSLQSIADLGAV
jgi:hypothetical protein